jgi:serine/threonine-protein kinase
MPEHALAEPTTSARSVAAIRQTASSAFLAMGSVPRDTEEGRSFLQARVRAIGRLGFFLNSLFYVLTVILMVLFGIRGGLCWAGLVSDFAGALLVNSVVFGAQWFLTSRGQPGVTWLYCIDAAGVFVSSTVLAAAAWIVAPGFRPELVSIIAICNLLIVRAVIVPGSAARTTWLSVACSAPTVVVTFLFYQAHPPAPELHATPIAYTSVAGLFLLSGVIVATYVTHVIYGLTQKVREATQLGQYTLDEKIGEGGMGIVFKARHSMLRRPTAVKLLPPEKAGEHNILRFEREVQLTSLLTHPNTIAIYDFGRTPEGVFYYAMEYLDGFDLEDLVDEAGPLDPARTIHILLQIAGALDEAHGVGLIHRDIKPANVILCERGSTPDVAKVLDFGLVKRQGKPEDPALSGTNVITGTPLFLAPEAILTPEKIDGRSDLYALGCVGYYLLTGTYPFNGATVLEICGHHLHTAPEPPSARLGKTLPPDLERVIMRCIEKKPDQRPHDAAALFEELHACDDASAWSPVGARKWWRERGREIRRRVRDRGELPASTSRPRTIAVDLRTRVSQG